MAPAAGDAMPLHRLKSAPLTPPGAALPIHLAGSAAKQIAWLAAPSWRDVFGVRLRDQRKRHEVRPLYFILPAHKVKIRHFHAVIGLRIGVLVNGANNFSIVDQLANVCGIVPDKELDLRDQGSGIRDQGSGIRSQSTKPPWATI